MTLFSKRFQRALFDRRLVVGTVPALVRQRMWMTMGAFNRWWDTVSDTGWHGQTCTVDETEAFLKREYGGELIAYRGDDERGPVDFETFVRRCRPSNFMDIVEAYYAQIDQEGERERFHHEANRIFREENLGWRLSAGELFKLDSEFLEAEVLARTEELLQAHGFAGALDEFREARNELTAGDVKGTIIKAQSAFESTMKTILGVRDGNAASLIRDLVAQGFFGDLPPHVSISFGESVLRALPFMGNRLGRHGQGEDVVEVPRHYGELALHIAGSFIRLLVERHVELQPPPAPAPAAVETPDFAAADDDIPF